MKIVCDSCGAKYSIADEKVAGKVFKIRCKKCSAVIVVKGDQQSEGAEQAAAPGEDAGDAAWHVVVSGEQQGPFAPRQIGELLAEGKIDWEAYVWREGMDNWLPAKDVEALVKSVMAESEGGESAALGASGGLAGEVFGGSNDMGADPFASSDDGGLSGVIGQAAASSVGSAGPDLFADSSRNAFAAAADDDQSGASHRPTGGSSPKVSEAQSLTGQRNENSVLFSLSNLQALATGSGAAPTTTGRPKPGMAQGEGSGLIDIRALASATQAVAEKPNGSSRDKVEDLMAVGSANTTFSATALAAPVAVEKPDHSKTLLYGMAAAILALGVVVTLLVTRQPEPRATAQLTPTQEPAAAAAAAAGSQTPTGAPQAAEPTPPPADKPAQDEPEDKRSAAREEGEGEREHSSRRSHDRGDKAEKSEKSEKKSEKTEEPVAAAPEPKKTTSSGDKSLDDLLSTALGGKAKPAAAKPAPSENLPATPSRDDVLSAMKGVAGKVTGCGGGQSGIAMAKVTVAGSGKVNSVDVSGQFAGTPVASCISKEVAKAKFSKFSQTTFSFSYPFKL